ncbi:MAG: alpha/beta hydrolase [Gemmatimonas sp.]
MGGWRLLVSVLVVLVLGASWHGALAQEAKVGVFVMHGKGKKSYVGGLANALEKRGYLVANPGMAWGAREYDVSVEQSDVEIENGLKALRDKGARRVFLAGHSIGAVVAIHYAVAHPLDGVIAIAPGAFPENPTYIKTLADEVQKLRDAVTAGRGGEKITFREFEPHVGRFPVRAPAAAILSYFEPEGPLNFKRNIAALPPELPVLYIVSSGDVAHGFGVYSKNLFSAVPKNPLTRLFEPQVEHFDAPTASIDETVAFIESVVASRP